MFFFYFIFNLYLKKSNLLKSVNYENLRSQVFECAFLRTYSNKMTERDDNQDYDIYSYLVERNFKIDSIKIPFDIIDEICQENNENLAILKFLILMVSVIFLVIFLAYVVKIEYSEHMRDLGKRNFFNF